MSDLNQPRLTRLTRRLQEAGWRANPEGITSNPVKLWIYSVSFEAGPRLVTQVGTQLYREMMAHSGLIADLMKIFNTAEDTLADVLREYDALPSPDERSRQALTMFLALYACSTKTWQLVRPLNQVDGAHFFVFDWQKKDSNTTVLRPAHHHQAGPMRKEEITSLLNFVLQTHLTLHPADAPRFDH